MRQILKKVSALCAAAVCSTTLLFGASAVYAEEETEMIKTQLAEETKMITESIVAMEDEKLEEMAGKTGDAIFDTMLESWISAKKEVGELVALGDAEVTITEKEYTAVVPADFEIYDAEFTYVFSAETMTPTAILVDVEYPMSVKMQQAGMNTVMGLGTVFLVLVFLMFIISLFKFIPSGNKKKAAAAPAPAPAPAPVAVVEEEVDDLELIAVIAAAIAAAEGAESADGYVVRSIRKVNRKVR